MIAELQTDTDCAVSWRSRPASFVSLMSLYESNYIRLGWLIKDLASVSDTAVSKVEGVRSARANLVFDPPWDASKMSDEAKLALNMF